MRKYLFIVVCFVFFSSCKNKNDKDSYNPPFPDQKPRVTSTINLDNIVDSTIIPMEIIWDGRPDYYPKSLNIPKRKCEFSGSFSSVISGPGDTLLALDKVKKRIIKFSDSGKWLDTIGKQGFGPGEMENPYWMINYKNRSLYIFDLGTHWIHIIDMVGKPIRQLIKIKYIRYPEMFALGKNGDVIMRAITEDPHLMIIYDSLGAEKRKIGNLVDKGKDAYQRAGYNQMSIYFDDENNLIYCFYEFLPLIRIFNYGGDYIQEITLDSKKIAEVSAKNLEQMSKATKGEFGGTYMFGLYGNFLNNKILIRTPGCYELSIDKDGRFKIQKIIFSCENEYFLPLNIFIKNKRVFGYGLWENIILRQKI